MKHKGQGSRLQQVIDWLGGPSFDGCIVLDEAHKAKSFVPGKEAQSSKVCPSGCVKILEGVTLNAEPHGCF